MATYKVLQDIEAEDKLLGPLTLKQFIFAIITLAFGFFAYLFIQINPILAIPWIVPISFFGFMAAPINKDQPNDIWLAARIRFLIKPRKRVWDQAGMQELVTITVPKKIEISRTDGLNQEEVKSRLSALSSLMDTRGWAVKGASESIHIESFSRSGMQSDTSRLINLDNFESNSIATDVKDSEDILDPLNNMIAQRIDSAIKQKHTSKIEDLKKQMQNKTEAFSGSTTAMSPALDYSFINPPETATQPGYATFGDRVIKPGKNDILGQDLAVDLNVLSANEKQILDQIHHQQEITRAAAGSSHEHRVEPVDSKISGSLVTESSAPQTATDAIIKQLGQANDISVATVAKLAEHAEQEAALKDNDVISLH